jgi:hypothetical protein
MIISGGAGVGIDLPDESLQLGVAEELLELLHALPFVDDHDDPVAHPEPVVKAPAAWAAAPHFSNSPARSARD